MRLRKKTKKEKEKDPSWDEIKENNKQNMAKYREKLKPEREIEVRKSLPQIYLLLLLLLFVVKSEAKRWVNKIKEQKKKKKKSDLELKTYMFSLHISREKLKWEM